MALRCLGDKSDQRFFRVPSVIDDFTVSGSIDTLFRMTREPCDHASTRASGADVALTLAVIVGA